MTPPSNRLVSRTTAPGWFLGICWLIFVVSPAVILWGLLQAARQDEFQRLHTGQQDKVLQEMSAYLRELEPAQFLETILSDVVTDCWKRDFHGGGGLGRLKTPAQLDLLRRQLEQTVGFRLAGMFWHGPDTRSCEVSVAPFWPGMVPRTALLSFLFHINGQEFRRRRDPGPAPLWQRQLVDLAPQVRAQRILGFQKALFGDISRGRLKPGHVVSILSGRYGGGRQYFLYLPFGETERGDAPLLGGCLLVVRERDLSPADLLRRVARQSLVPGVVRAWRTRSSKALKALNAEKTGAVYLSEHDGTSFLLTRPGQSLNHLFLARGTLRTSPSSSASQGKMPLSRSILLETRMVRQAEQGSLIRWIPPLGRGILFAVLAGSSLFLYLWLFGFSLNLRLRGKILLGAVLASLLPIGLLLFGIFLQNRMQRERGRDAAMNRLQTTNHMIERLLRTHFQDLNRELLTIGERLEPLLASTSQVATALEREGNHLPVSEALIIGADDTRRVVEWPREGVGPASPVLRETLWGMAGAVLDALRMRDAGRKPTVNIHGISVPLTGLGEYLARPGKLTVMSLAGEEYYLAAVPIQREGESAVVFLRFPERNLVRDFFRKQSAFMSGLQDEVGGWKLRVAALGLEGGGGSRIVNALWEPRDTSWQGCARHARMSAALGVGSALTIEGPEGRKIISTHCIPRLPCLLVGWGEAAAAGNDLASPVALLAYVVLLLVFVVTLMGKVFREPVLDFVRVAEAIERGDYPDQPQVSGEDEIGKLGDSFHQMVRGLRHRDELAAFVSDEVLEAVQAESEAGLRPGGELRDVTVLFASLRGFSTWSAAATTDSVVEVLNSFLDAGETVFREAGGSLDKIIEDTLMAVFQPKKGLPAPAFRAAKAALALQERLGTALPRLSEGFPANPACTIGLASGTVLSGRVGSRRGALDFSVIGKPVNLAARLKAQAHKTLETGIIVAPSTIRQLSGRARVRFVERSAIKGMTRSFNLYELLGLR